MGCCCSKEQDVDDEAERTPLLGDKRTEPSTQGVTRASPNKRQDVQVGVDSGLGRIVEPVDEQPQPEYVRQPNDTKPTKVDFKPIQVPRYDQQMEANVARFHDYLAEYEKLQNTSGTLCQMYPEHNAEHTVVGCFKHVKNTLADKLPDALTVTDPSCPWITYKVELIHHSLLPALNTFNKACRLVKDITHEGPQLTVAVDDVTFAEPDMRKEITKCTKQLKESTKNLYMDNCSYDIQQFFRIKGMLEQMKSETQRICAELQAAANIITVSPSIATNDLQTRDDPTQEALQQSTGFEAAEEKPASSGDLASDDDARIKIVEEKLQQTAACDGRHCDVIGEMPEVTPVGGEADELPRADTSADAGEPKTSDAPEVKLEDQMADVEPRETPSAQEPPRDATEDKTSETVAAGTPTTVHADADPEPAKTQETVTTDNTEKQDSTDEQQPTEQPDEESAKVTASTPPQVIAEEGDNTSTSPEDEKEADQSVVTSPTPPVEDPEMSNISPDNEQISVAASTEHTYAQPPTEITSTDIPKHASFAEENDEVKQDSDVKPEGDDQAMPPSADQSSALSDVHTSAPPIVNGGHQEDDDPQMAPPVLPGPGNQDEVAAAGQQTIARSISTGTDQSSGDVDHDTESPADASKPAASDHGTEAVEKKVKKRRTKKGHKRQKSGD